MGMTGMACLSNGASVKHLCGREQGIDTVSPYKHNEYIVYENAGQKQTYVEFALVYRRKGIVLSHPLEYAFMKEGNVGSKAVLLHIRCRRLLVFDVHSEVLEDDPMYVDFCSSSVE